MIDSDPIDFERLRDTMKAFDPSPKIEPNARVELDQAFFPDGHRGVFDFNRPLVLGNRGMGKSFWTHALLNQDLRARIAQVYGLPALAHTDVRIGFNGSEKLGEVAATRDDIKTALTDDIEADLTWRAVILRAADKGGNFTFKETVARLRSSPSLYSQVLTSLDNSLVLNGTSILIVFDALDLLANDWLQIRALTKALLTRVIGLQSFRRIRAKVFMRIDQFADRETFSFADSSKLINNRVNLTWKPHELYGLMLWDLIRISSGSNELDRLAERIDARPALPRLGRVNTSELADQERLIAALAGEFMGSHKKRGRVYSWIPLHLGDTANNCSPRTFLTAWKSAAEHVPPARTRVVDHLGLIEGVRNASRARLAELREDLPWIDAALVPLRRQFVPMLRDELYALWSDYDVVDKLLEDAEEGAWLLPLAVFLQNDNAGLLATMKLICVMEERANGKINVPDIFRVEAGILRKGGVAVPRRS
jgi:hypothetical protein